MTISTYSELKSAIDNWLERNDLSSSGAADEAIDLCEAEMQRELKLQAFETTGNVTVTSGTGALPTGFNKARSVYWATDPNRVLRYVTPNELERIKSSTPSEVNYYTVVGTSVLVADDQSGTLVMTYTANFTPLDGTNTTNSILTNHPACYLYGSLAQAAIFCKDFDSAARYRTIFESELQQVKADNTEKKYVGQLAVRAA